MSNSDTLIASFFSIDGEDLDPDACTEAIG